MGAGVASWRKTVVADKNTAKTGGALIGCGELLRTGVHFALFCARSVYISSLAECGFVVVFVLMENGSWKDLCKQCTRRPDVQSAEGTTPSGRDVITYQ